MLNKELFYQKIKLSSGLSNAGLSKEIKSNEEKLNFLIELTNFLPSSFDISLRLFYVQNNITEQLKCAQCGNLLSNKNKFCSKKCSALYINSNNEFLQNKSLKQKEIHKNRSIEEKETISNKRQNTNLERYGVLNNMHIKDVRENTKLKWIEKYGSDNPNKNINQKQKISKTKLDKAAEEKISIVEKQKQTYLLNYGVDNPLKDDNIKNKIKQTNLKKYGCEYVSQNADIRKKINATMYEKYGTKSTFNFESTKKTIIEKYSVEYIGQSQEIKDKIKQTCLDKYGVTNGLLTNNCRSKFNPRTYTKLNELVYSLLLEYFDKDDIEKEFYLNNENNNKKTFFDFYIKSLNLLIEANGDYWHCNPFIYDKDFVFMKNSNKECLAIDVWKKDKEKINNAKQLGYDIIVIWEYDFNNNLEKIKNNLKQLKWKK